MENKKSADEILLNEVKDRYIYDAKSGMLNWKSKRKGININSPVGGLNNTGYLFVKINYKQYLIHRIIWLLEKGSMPENNIDHINGNRLDNRISNLREADHRKNNGNQDIHRKGALVGAHFNKAVGRWYAVISIKKRKVSLGRCETSQQAHQRYMACANALRENSMLNNDELRKIAYEI